MLNRKLGLYCLLFVLAPCAWAGTSVPDWVRTAATEKLPTYSNLTKAVVLLRETTYTVHPDGKAERHVREVIKILRPQGRSYGEAKIAFNSDQKLNYFHVWSIGPDGHEYELKDRDQTEYGLGERFILYSDERVRVGKPSAIDPGSVMAYEYSQKVRPYEAEAQWNFQSAIPVRRTSYILELPFGWEYRDYWFCHPKVAAKEAGPNRWQWQLENIPAIDMDDVPLAPAADAFEGRMAVAYYGAGLARTGGDWGSLGKWYAQLTQDRAVATPEIASKAQALAAGKTDFADRVQAVAEFSQGEIRYVAISIGIGGYQPHVAADIYRNRYGDCKDKATLLKAMLGAIGVRANYLMVDTDRGVVSPDVPSTYGNHMITAIELPPGYTSERLHSVVKAKSGTRYLIFDPTSSYTPFGQLESALQGSYGALFDGVNSEAVLLPVLSPADNLLERNGQFILEADGTLKGEMTEHRSGETASYRRYLYSEKTVKDQREALEGILRQDFASFTLTTNTAENIKPLNSSLTLKYSLTAPRYAKQTGALLLLRPRVLGSDTVTLDGKPRIYPIDLDSTRVVRDTFEVQLPPGYTLDELPDQVHLETGFASYSSHSEMHDRILRYTREYTIRQLEIPADKYGELQTLIATIEADERNNAVLKKID